MKHIHEMKWLGADLFVNSSIDWIINATPSTHFTLKRKEKFPSITFCCSLHLWRLSKNHIGRVMSSARVGPVVRTVSLKHWVNLGSVVSHVRVTFHNWSGQNEENMLKLTSRLTIGEFAPIHNVCTDEINTLKELATVLPKNKEQGGVVAKRR